jgi:hypothetical protein
MSLLQGAGGVDGSDEHVSDDERNLIARSRYVIESSLRAGLRSRIVPATTHIAGHLRRLHPAPVPFV